MARQLRAFRGSRAVEQKGSVVGRACIAVLEQLEIRQLLAGISVNFTGGRGDQPPQSLAATDIAGVVPLANFNNVAGGNGTSIVLNDDTGVDSLARLTFNGGGTYGSVGGMTPAGGDEMLNTGFVYGTTTVTVSNIPYAQYDVYVYELNDGGGRVETTSLQTSYGRTYYGSAATPNDASHIDGDGGTAYVYTQTVSTDAGSPTANGDYVLFAKVRGSTLTFQTSAPGNGYLNGFQIIPSTAAPDQVTGVTAIPGGAPGAIKLAWSGTPGAVTYNIYRGTTAGGEGATPVHTGITATSFIDNGLTPGNTYYYTVEAVNPAGVGPQSAEASGAADTVFAAPTMVNATRGTSTVTVTWNVNPSATGYNIYRGTAPDFVPAAGNRIGTGVGGASFVDSTPLAGTAYYIVTAVGSGGTGESLPSNRTRIDAGTGFAAQYFQNNQQAGTDGTPATFQRIETSLNWSGNNTDLPAGLPASFNTGFTHPKGETFSARWDAIITAPSDGNYVFYPRTDDGVRVDVDGVTLENILGNGRAPTEDTLPVGTAWTMGSTHTVTMYFQQGVGGWDMELRYSATNVPKQLVPTSQAAPVLPLAPVLQAFPGDQAVYLQWNALAANTYSVYRDTTPGFTPSSTNRIASGLTAANYLDTAGLTNGSTYYYVVTGTNQTGEGPGNTPVAAAVNPQAPTMAAALSIAKQAYHKVDLSWSPVQFATSYNVYRGTSAGGESTTPLNASPITGTTFSDTTTQVGTTYYYIVKGVNVSGIGAASNEVVANYHNGSEAFYYTAEYWRSNVPALSNQTALPDNYFLDKVMGTPDIRSWLPRVSFDGPPESPVPNEHYSAIFTGKLLIQHPGNYTFASSTDDDGFLFVNGQAVTTDPGGHGTRTAYLGAHENPFTAGTPVTFNLQTGADGVNPISPTNPLTLDYVLLMSQGYGGSGAHLQWSSSDAGNGVPTGMTDMPQANLLSLTGAPLAPASFQVDPGGTTAPFSVPLQFNDISNNELYFLVQRSTTETFAPGTYTTIKTFGINDNAPGSTSGNTTLNPVTINFVDTTNPLTQAVWYRVVARNFDGSASSGVVAVPATATSQEGAVIHYYNDQWWKSTDRSTTAVTSRGAAIPADVNTTLLTVDASGNQDAGPYSGVRSEYFSAVVTGKVHITTGGTYSFISQTDDDGYLYVNNQLVASDPGGHGNRNAPNVYPITLAPGDYNFQLFQSQGGGGWDYHLTYNGPDSTGTQTVIPSTALRTISDLPVAVTGLAGTSTLTDRVNLTWNDNNISEVRYVVLRSLKSFADPTLTDADITTLTAGINSTGMTDMGLAPNTTYHYLIRADNFDGSSPASSEIQVTTGNTLPPPTNVKLVQSGAYHGKVSWDSTVLGTAPVAGFLIQRSTDPTFATGVVTVGTTPGSQNTFIDTGAYVIGTPYYYRVQATGSGTIANSAFSANGSFAALPVSLPIDYSGGFGVTLPASGTIITDGGFETPAQTPDGFTYQPAGTSYTFTGTTGVLNGNGDGFGGPGGVEGSQYLFLQMNPGDGHYDPVNGQTVTQAINIATAGAYYFTGFESYRNGYAPAPYEVLIDGTVVFTSTPASTGWVERLSPVFNLTAGAHSLQFRVTGPASGDKASYIDAARIVPAVQLALQRPFTTNGGAYFTGSTLRLTDQGWGQARSAFYTPGVDLTGNFTATFDFRLTMPSTNPDDAGDGLTFTVQANDPTQVGWSGGSMGYESIPNSLAISFNIYNNVTQAGIGINGGSPKSSTFDMAPNLGNAFHVLDAQNQTDVFHVVIAYDNTTKTVRLTVTDPANVTATPFTHDFTGIDIPSIASHGYFGFTGGTGGARSTQDILNFKLDYVSAPAAPESTHAFMSGPHKLTFAFSQDVSASLGVDDLVIQPLPSGTPIVATSVTWDPVTRTASFFLPDTIANANYHATLKAAGVTNSAGTPMAADVGLDFWELKGDSNRDRSVNFIDLVAVAQNYNTASGATWTIGDFNGDGAVNFIDLVAVAQNYNTSLPAPGAVPAEPAPSAAMASAPVESAPAASAPVESAPVESAPAESAPVESDPVESAPVESAPVADTEPLVAQPVTAAPVADQTDTDPIATTAIDVAVSSAAPTVTAAAATPAPVPAPAPEAPAKRQAPPRLSHQKTGRHGPANAMNSVGEQAPALAPTNSVFSTQRVRRPDDALWA